MASTILKTVKQPNVVTIGAGVKSPGSATTPAPGTPGSHQAYIDKTMGGAFSSGKYAQDNIDRLNRGEIGYDQLLADSKRVGYDISGVNRADTTKVDQGPDINGIYDNYYQAALGKLRSARDTQLAGLAGQDDLIKQTGYDNRNSNDVMAAQALQRVREQQANQGINGGDSITAQLSNNTDRQNGANAINTNEGNQLKQLMAMRNAINNNASAEDLALLQQNQGDRASALLGQYNTDRQYGLQLGGLTGNFNGQRTLQGQQFDRGVFESDRTFDFNKTTDQRNFDYTVGRDKVADKSRQQEFDYRVKQDGLQNAIAWYNAKTSRQNSNNSGAPKTSNNPFVASVYSELDQLDPSEYEGYLTDQRAEIISKIGQKGFDDLKKSALSGQNNQSEADAAKQKANFAIREKAIAAAQKDFRWNDPSQHDQLIKEYEALFR